MESSINLACVIQVGFLKREIQATLDMNRDMADSLSRSLSIFTSFYKDGRGSSAVRRDLNASHLILDLS